MRHQGQPDVISRVWRAYKGENNYSQSTCNYLPCIEKLWYTLIWIDIHVKPIPHRQVASDSCVAGSSSNPQWHSEHGQKDTLPLSKFNGSFYLHHKINYLHQFRYIHASPITFISGNGDLHPADSPNCIREAIPLLMTLGAKEGDDRIIQEINWANWQNWR